MRKSNSIIPEFMIKNKDDTFMFLMPLRLKIVYYRNPISNLSPQSLCIFHQRTKIWHIGIV